MIKPNEPEDVPIPSYEELVEERNRPRTPHHALKMAVRNGDLTPKQAEEKAREQGLPLWHDGYEELHDVTVNSIWPLSLFLIFLAWRDLTHAREQWERYQIWGPDIQRDSCNLPQLDSFESVKNSVLMDLRAGVFRVFGYNSEGKQRTVPYEEWDHLLFGSDWDCLIYSSDREIAYRDICLLRHEVVPFFINEQGVNSQYSKTQQRERGDQPAQKRGGGRPSVHDWAAATGYVTGYIVENDYPTDKNEESFSLKLKKWFETERGKSPDFRDIQRFVAEVLKHRPPPKTPPKSVPKG